MKERNVIEKFIKDLGLTEFGIIKCRELSELIPYFQERKEKNLFNEFEQQDISLKVNPNFYMAEGKSIISIAFPYLHTQEVIDNGFSLYTRGSDYHKVVKLYLNKICEYIEGLGGKAIPLVDSNNLPERYLAYLAGVGFIGKNNMIITKKYGSYVFLGEIITDLEIYSSDIGKFEDIIKFNDCGDCEICYKECPTKSINRFKKNSNICASYLTQKKELTDIEIKLIGGRVFGCDSCQLKCPYNDRVEKSNILEFEPFDFMVRDDTDNILSLSNKGFKESYLKTSCGWRGKNVLKRNALIRTNNIDKNSIQNIKTDSEYLKNYQHRLLNNN